MQKNLACRPCSKHGQGPCTNIKYHQECLASISPKDLQSEIKKLYQGSGNAENREPWN